MKTAALALALLAGCAANQETTEAAVAPADSEAARAAAPTDANAPPAPTITDSAPESPTPMPPSRLNVVPSVSPDKPLAESIGTASDAPDTLQATPATAGDLAKGVAVNDPSGQPVGTIDSISDTSVVLAIGEQRIQVPRNTIGKNEKGLVIGMTKDQLVAGTAKPSQ